MKGRAVSLGGPFSNTLLELQSEPEDVFVGFTLMEVDVRICNVTGSPRPEVPLLSSECEHHSVNPNSEH